MVNNFMDTPYLYLFNEYTEGEDGLCIRKWGKLMIDLLCVCVCVCVCFMSI